ncbi:MAG: PEP-CTERM sorting domain-containing protein [Verrucomicrobiia bacterium]
MRIVLLSPAARLTTSGMFLLGLISLVFSRTTAAQCIIGVQAEDATATLQVAGSPSGLDQAGDPATYYYALGYGDETGSPTYLAQASLSAADIQNLAPGTLVTAIYNNLEGQLSAPFQSDLTLNLANNTLVFAVPASIPDPSVAGSSTDLGLALSCSYITGLAIPVSDPPSWTISPVPGDTTPPSITVNMSRGGVASSFSLTPTMNTALDMVNALNNALVGAGLANNCYVSAGECVVPNNVFITSITSTPSATVPEPSTFALLGLGAVSLLAYVARRRTAKA